MRSLRSFCKLLRTQEVRASFGTHIARLIIIDIGKDKVHAVCPSPSPTIASYVHYDITCELDTSATILLYRKLDIIFNNVNFVKGSTTTDNSQHRVKGNERSVATELGKYGVRVNYMTLHIVVMLLVMKGYAWMRVDKLVERTGNVRE